MRAIIFLLLIMCWLSYSCSAAPCDTCRKGHPIIDIALITTSVVTGALADGLNSRMKYSSGHFLATVSIASLLAVPFVVKPNWKLPVTYILLRYALFDALYNVGAHRNLNYIGGKNYYDESIGKMPRSAFDATKIASIGIVILINRKNK